MPSDESLRRLVRSINPGLADRLAEIDVFRMTYAGIDLSDMEDCTGIYPVDLGAEGEIIIDGTATEINEEKEIRALRDMRELD